MTNSFDSKRPPMGSRVGNESTAISGDNIAEPPCMAEVLISGNLAQLMTTEFFMFSRFQNQENHLERSTFHSQEIRVWLSRLITSSQHPPQPREAGQQL